MERYSLTRVTMSTDGVELMFVGIGYIFVLLLIVLYTRINEKRKAELEHEGGVSKYSVEELHEMGDRAPDFIYTL